MYQKEKKLNPVLLIVLAVVLLAVGIAVWFLLTHVRVAGTFYSRNADVLDLRFADVTTADYDKLRKKAPNSEILWRIPFQGKTYDQDTDVLYVTSLTDEDVATLDYFTRLKTVEAQECTDYPQLAALTALPPGEQLRAQLADLCPQLQRTLFDSLAGDVGSAGRIGAGVVGRDVGVGTEDRNVQYAMLACGYVDAIAAHETAILQYMKDNYAVFRILEEPLLVTGLGVAFAKNDSRGLDHQLNDTFAQMREDGTLERIVGKYLEHASQYLEVDTIDA